MISKGRGQSQMPTAPVPETQNCQSRTLLTGSLHLVPSQRLRTTWPCGYGDANSANFVVLCSKQKPSPKVCGRGGYSWLGGCRGSTIKMDRHPAEIVSGLIPQSPLCASRVTELQMGATRKPSAQSPGGDEVVSRNPGKLRSQTLLHTRD